MTYSEKLYQHSPVALQNLLVSLKGLQFRLKRANSNIIAETQKALLSTEFNSEEQFERQNTILLRQLLSNAKTNIEAYHSVPSEVVGDTTHDLLANWPILSKSELRGNEDRYRDCRFSKRDLKVFGTSGTTGTPIKIYETKRSFSQRWAFVARLRHSLDIDGLYPRRAQFTGRDIIPDTGIRSGSSYWRRNIAGNALLLSTSHIAPETIPGYAQALCDFRPDLIDGYPSALVAIARVCIENHISLPSPKGIITSAETLLPEWRRDIETAFRCQVRDQYAASEPTCFWSECEHQRMHINPEYGISEVLQPDGSPAAPGEAGEVVTTSLLNPAMPLIRYRIGDTAIRSKEVNCPCGRSMPIIERVVGRTDDVFYIPDRGFIGRLDPVFKGLSGIVEAQIVQKTLDWIDVFIVPSNEFNNTVQTHLMKNLRSKVGQTVHIHIEKVQRIPRGANGKFRPVISKVRDQYPISI